MEKYGMFASIMLAIGGLFVTFAAIRERTMGALAEWTQQGGSIPKNIAITGPRLVAFVLMVVVYLFVNNDNFRIYLFFTFILAVIGFALFARFHKLSKIYVQKVPVPNKDGTQKTDDKGDPVFVHRVIGSESQMRASAKKHYDEYLDKNPGADLETFLRGYGSDQLNRPESAWTKETLASNSMKIALTLMYSIVAAVTTVFTLGAILAMFAGQS